MHKTLRLRSPRRAPRKRPRYRLWRLSEPMPAVPTVVGEHVLRMVYRRVPLNLRTLVRDLHRAIEGPDGLDARRATTALRHLLVLIGRP